MKIGAQNSKTNTYCIDLSIPEISDYSSIGAFVELDVPFLAAGNQSVQNPIRFDEGLLKGRPVPTGQHKVGQQFALILHDLHQAGYVDGHSDLKSGLSRLINKRIEFLFISASYTSSSTRFVVSYFAICWCSRTLFCSTTATIGIINTTSIWHINNRRPSLKG